MSTDSNPHPAPNDATIFTGLVAATLDAVAHQEQQVAEHLHRELHPAPATAAPAPETAPETAP